ncbi:hypothetical protein BS47DRAFT_1340779 [Hydnum rufescens UP504]|uniref:Uncharacterized protein n=1 Tax=Hydnum rufescens UP504 TaxID=1448309 RepID=A0A9P6DWJ2_9AGAM|nr:hypothetical protein BS47DRAFT_1340779 [Hydnum rufescens UP504]
MAANQSKACSLPISSLLDSRVSTECVPSASIIMRDHCGGNNDHEKQKEGNKDDHGTRESSCLRLTEQSRGNGSEGDNSDRDRGTEKCISSPLLSHTVRMYLGSTPRSLGNYPIERPPCIENTRPRLDTVQMRLHSQIHEYSAEKESSGPQPW